MLCRGSGAVYQPMLCALRQLAIKQSERLMRILLVSKFFPPVHGGIEAMAFELAEGLHKRNHTVDVLCANSGFKTVHDFGFGGYSVVRTSSLGRVLSTSISPAMAMTMLARRRQYDLIHVELPDPMACFAVWASRPEGKLVLRWHSDVVAQVRAMKLYAPLQHWMLSRADAITATSEPYARASRWLTPFRDKVHVIPLGIRDVPTGSDAAVEIRRRYAGKRIVFSLGRMTYYKGFDTLIRAAAHLPLNHVVLIGGAGELLQQHQETVRQLGLEDRITLLGRLTDAEVVAHLHACDVFCLPSNARSEAFGVVLLEAMAAGKPVVTTDIEGSGVPWVCQHGVTGLVVPVNDPPALATAIAKITADDTVGAFYASRARHRYLSLFTAERMVQSTADLFTTL